MSLTVVGIAMGAFVAFMSFQFGVWGFLVSLLFMGIGAMAGYYAARAAVTALSPYGIAAMLLGSLLMAFLAYEAALFVATFVLPRGEGAFNYDVMTYVSTVEVIAFIVLLVAHRLAVATGLIGRNAVERTI